MEFIKKIHTRFILRQITLSSRQAFVFMLCVGMSIASLTAFSGLSASINRSLLKDARKLHAADIIIRSNDRISKGLEQSIANMVHDGNVSLIRYYEFYSVVRTLDEDASLLSRLKIVEQGYPFYGEVELLSGRPFRDVLTPGSAIVGKSLLVRMGVSVGDNIRVGYTTLKIRDVIQSEPDRLFDAFSFGPRIFISSNDLERLGLLKAGSRVRYVSLLKVHDEKQLETIADQLKNAALDNEERRERIDTYKTRNSRIKRSLDNFFFFLKLIGIFIMLISGVGIQSSLGALLKEKRYGIAVMKSIGATNRYITLHIIIIVFFMCLTGTGIGILGGGLLQYGLWKLLSPFFPPETQLSIVWPVVLEAVILGFAVVAVFTFIPLYRLREIRPIMIFREELPGTAAKRPIYLAGILLVLFFSGLVLRHMKDFYFGIYFVLGIAAVFLTAYLLTRFLLFVLKRLNPRRLAFRQAVKGLFRTGSASNAIIITLVSSLCVVFSIYLIEQNLDATFVSSYPEDAPNVFILDIQPGQVTPFLAMMEHKPVMYPVIRARIVSINGERINRDEEHRRHGDNLGRTFNLTYRKDLLEEEEIIRGKTLFREEWQGPQVSVLDDVMEMRKIDINDIITFNIQGVPLDARVSSIRTQKRESFSPFFYFVFQEDILKDAPQTIFSALRVNEEEIPALQTRVVKKFPNVSVIDVAGSIGAFASLLKRLTAIIRGLSALGIISGALIIISSVFATRSERIVESVYYKILGAKKGFVFRVFTMENLIIASLSGIMALIIAHGTTYLICRNVFKISYHFFVFSSSIMLGATIILIILIGIISSRSILMKKPVGYLRKRADE